MLRIIVLVAFLAIAAQANKCPAGKAGANCELDDPCASKNPCKDGKVCHGLDASFKPVCACPLGFKGDKCAERDCPITSYKGKAIFGNVNIDAEGVEKFKKLDELAQACKVRVNVTKSFTRSINPTDEVAEKDMALFIGRGINFELNNEKNEKLCDTACLAKTPAPKSPVECFLSKLKGAHSASNPGVLQAKAFSLKSKEDTDFLRARQVGCQLRKDLPVAPPSKLVGDWVLVGSENWDEFLQANQIGWWTRLALKALKPDVSISNSGKNWTIAVVSTFKNMRTDFTEGVKFTSKTPVNDEPAVHMVVSEGKDKLIEIQDITANPPRQIKIVREVNDKDQYVQTMTINGLVCKRIYGRKN